MNQQNNIQKACLSLGQPSDTYENHSFLVPLQLNPKSKLHYKLSLLIDKYVQETKGNKGPKQLEVFRQHWQWIILGLSRCFFMNSWLLVFFDKAAYSRDIWLKRYEIKYSSVKPIIDYLHQEQLITVFLGKRYKDRPSRTRVFPSKTLANQLWGYTLETEQSIEGPYLTINEDESSWKEIMFKLDEDHPDLGDMIAINEFLKGHQWACIAPVRLIYKYNASKGGRLFTPFQNLPDRKAKIRINTLIDDKPICEVDFNANHLRLNLAFNAKEHAGKTPYEDICHEAGVASKDHVKRFITIAMGADSEKKGRAALYKEGFNDEFINRIYKATQTIFPKLELFNGWGVFAQNYEGQIMKDVMVQGLQDDIVCLPVHDAVAVQQQHKEWAKNVMLETWSRHLEGVGTRVTVDMP